MLHTRVDKGVAPIVYLEGEVDLDCTETLRWVVSDAVRGSDQAVLDFAGVRFIDSSGAGIFVRLCLDLRAQGIQLRARNLSPAVEDVFAMLKVRELVGEGAFIAPHASRTLTRLALRPPDAPGHPIRARQRLPRPAVGRSRANA